MNHATRQRFERLPAGHRHALPDARRADPDRLREEIRAVSESPVVTAVLEVADAALLVLNGERQIVAFNSRVEDIREPEDVLGRRPGEAIGCVHAHAAGGCGLADACRSCGALGAVLRSQERGRVVESECLIQTLHGPGKLHEFNVRASPVEVDDTHFTVVSFRDISAEKRREVLEQVFIHDLTNTVSGLRGCALRLLRPGADPGEVGARLEFLSGQIEREVRDYRALLLAEEGTLEPQAAPCRTGELLAGVASLFSGHPVAHDRRIELGPPAEDVDLVSDASLLLRVLSNMVKNALEATERGGSVRVTCEGDPERVRFEVHNEGVIPAEVQPRVFQRSFSTKAERGRGLGTYSMKLFGERYLGGQVSFRSTAEAGTTFRLDVPRRGRPGASVH